MLAGPEVDAVDAAISVALVGTHSIARDLLLVQDLWRANQAAAAVAN